MLLVREVSGPTAAATYEHLTYRVTLFNRLPKRREAAQINWLIKSTDGQTLAHETQVGPELHLEIPNSWAGETAIVMPYLNSPTIKVSVSTTFAERPAYRRLEGASRTVKVTREGARFYASLNDEPRFYLGTRVQYEERRGLMNSSNPPGPRYRPDDYGEVHGQWAWYLFPTINCESNGSFTCLNTYDKARFTFGHFQLGAHTPDENFVAFFRLILQQLPTASESFPDLTVENGRIHRLTDGRSIPLESASSTTPLMNYLNPTSNEVDDTEAERAARVVDWCLRDKAVQATQVDFAVRQTKRKLRIHANKLTLDGLVDTLCLVVIDILHQGRAKYTTIQAALDADDPFEALMSIGASKYAKRIGTLRSSIRDLEVLGKVGENVYDKATADFVIPTGA
jgi:hypothetical protein